MAFSLFANVRSEAGRRSAPRNCVPMALSSYAAQASYMQVWTTANDRAATGALSLESRTPCKAAASHRTFGFGWVEAAQGQLDKISTEAMASFIPDQNKFSV